MATGAYTFLKRLLDLGVRNDDDVFKVRLKRAVNILTYNSIILISVAAVFGVFVLHKWYALFLFLAIPIHTLVFYLNLRDKVYWSVTMLFSISASLLTYFSLKIGEEGYTHSLFLLNILGLSLLYEDKSLRKYYWGNMIFTLACLLFVFVSYRMQWFDWMEDVKADMAGERRRNLYVIFSCSILFSIVIISSYSRQFRYLTKVLKEKEVLLAETNHRVKNNLSIINSLLNLKLEASRSSETKETLRDIQTRIHSMALVHEQLYRRKEVDEVYLDLYIEELIRATGSSFGDTKVISHQLDLEEVHTNLGTAIPFGMILNELLTNSYKYAFKDNERPELKISLKSGGDGKIILNYSDNGPGFDPQKLFNEDTLGMSLIQSLSEQIDGQCQFETENGLRFELIF